MKEVLFPRLAAFAGLVVFFGVGKFDGDGAFAEIDASGAMVFFTALCDIDGRIGFLIYFGCIGFYGCDRCGIGGFLCVSGDRKGEECE